MSTTRSRMIVSTLLVSAALVLGCTDQAPVDRSGGDTLVLRLGTSDGLVKVTSRSYAQDTFVKELELVSGGRIRVEVVTDVGAGAPEAESQVIEDVAAGDLDLGYAGTRAFPGAGVSGLDAAEAPFALTSIEAVEQLVAGPGGDLMLSALEDSGTVGLSLAVDGLRRPFGSERPLLSLDSWKNVAFRVYNSPVQDATVKALRGEPVSMTHGWIDAVREGKLDGVELSVDLYDELGLSAELPYVASNVVLWPKVLVFLVNQERLESLSGQQREWLQEAADRAQDASFAGGWDDAEHVRNLCSRGVRFANATRSQLNDLRTAVEPVYASLRESPMSADLLREVEAVAGRFPDPDAPDIPDRCGAASGDGSADEAGQPSALPDGDYRAEIPVSAVDAAGLSNGPGWSGVWTLTVDDATFALTCRPLDDPGRDCGGAVTDSVLEGGRLTGRGHRVSFVADADVMSRLTGCERPTATTSGNCPLLPTYSARWDLDGDRLRFSGGEGTSVHYLLITPWTRLR